MTNEEAIKIAKSTNPLMRGSSATSGEYVEVIIEALEKQMPKKPNQASVKLLDEEIVSNYLVCPVCEYPVMIGYPCKCGQMIDWSGVDDSR